MIRSDTIVHVTDQSGVAAARRVALRIGGSLSLGEQALGRAGIIVTELATNLVKHARGGSLLFGFDEEAAGAITITSIDKGSGIPNLTAAMQDGYSTAGSPGTGLGAIARAASSFDVYSTPDRGTVVVATVRDAAEPRDPIAAFSRITVAGICIPKPPEDECGDNWRGLSGRDFVTIGVIDGLGHGPAAAAASAAGVGVLRERGNSELPVLFDEMHGALRSTRGAAVGIARIHTGSGRVDFAGVGNIAGTIAEDDVARRTVSHGGIVGHEMRKVQTFSYPWSARSVLVLHSDGIGSAWSLAQYPGLLQREPAIIAAILYRDHCRGTDDATVVVAKAS